MQACDAHIINAVQLPDGTLYGEVYADAKGRFPDGERIRTTPARDIGHGMWETRSGTIYQVAFANEDKSQLYADLANCAVIGLEGAEPGDLPSGLSNLELSKNRDGLIATVEKDGAVRRFLLTVKKEIR